MTKQCVKNPSLSSADRMWTHKSSLSVTSAIHAGSFVFGGVTAVIVFDIRTGQFFA